MATKLTTPVTRPDITAQAILRFTFEVPHTLDAGEIVIDRPNVYVRYEVVTFNADREVINKQGVLVSIAEWPPAFLTDAKAIYALLETDAKNKGLIAPGTDEPLE